MLSHHGHFVVLTWLDVLFTFAHHVQTTPISIASGTIANHTSCVQAWRRQQMQREAQAAYRQMKGGTRRRADMRSLKALVSGS